MKKKIFSVLAIAILVFGVMFILTGCGNKDNSDKTSNKENNSNKTNEVVNVSKEKVIHGEYIKGGGYDSDIEMTFSEENKLTKLVLNYDCASEDAAQTFYDSSLKDVEGTDTDMKIDGKKVTITMSAEGYMKMSGLTEDQIDEGTMRQVAMGMGYNMKD